MGVFFPISEVAARETSQKKVRKMLPTGALSYGGYYPSNILPPTDVPFL
jgi:hypothetical protein